MGSNEREPVGEREGVGMCFIFIFLFVEFATQGGAIQADQRLMLNA
jgi:hypothetical protein